MIVLGMDTSSVNATVALMNDEKLIAEYIISNDRVHSVIIMPLLEDMLKKAGLKIDDVDVFGVCTGPGSFTGVRIGLTTMKTLSQVCKKPIVGVNSLNVLAKSFSMCDDKIICPIIDARHNQVYNSIYKNGKEIVSPRILDIDEILDELKDTRTIFCGDGILTLRDKLKSNDKWEIAPQSLSMQRASMVCQIAIEKATANEFDNLYTLNALYLRKSQAERERDEKLKNKQI